MEDLIEEAMHYLMQMNKSQLEVIVDILLDRRPSFEEILKDLPQFKEKG